MMNSCAVLLEEKLEAELRLLAEAGFGSQARGIWELLTKPGEKVRHAAFERAYDTAARVAGEKSLRPLLGSMSFHGGVVTGLLDPVQGFDIQCAADIWGAQLPLHALALRRFFSLLESALRQDGTWGPILVQYQGLRFREDVLAALQARMHPVHPGRRDDGVPSSAAHARSVELGGSKHPMPKPGPGQASSSPIRFQVVPGTDGEQTIRVDLDYQIQCLQQVTIEVKVQEVPAMGPSKAMGPGKVAEVPISVRPIKVGMLLGVGGLGDKSFNDSAYYGLEVARRSFGVEFEAETPGTIEQNTAMLQRWAKAGYDLLIAVGDDHRHVIAQVARAFPQKCFAIVDTDVPGGNVWSAVFREYEGDYVVGVLAALAAVEGRIGFLGGVKTPVVRRIESAFWQGVKSVNPNVVLNVVYANKFDDELIGRSLAQILYAVKEVDVIYQAAGRSGIGAIWAARDLKKLIISTGGDHSDLAPSAVLTSRIKNMYRPVLDAIKAVMEERFAGGQTASYGIANGGLSLTAVQPAVAERLPPNVQVDYLNTCMDETLEAVTSGQIVVDLDQE